MKNLSYCITKKELKVKKAEKSQGSVCIHFPNQDVRDITLSNDQVVDVFGRIGITQEDVKRSNIQVLLNQGLIVLV